MTKMNHRPTVCLTHKQLKTLARRIWTILLSLTIFASASLMPMHVLAATPVTPDVLAASGTPATTTLLIGIQPGTSKADMVSLLGSQGLELVRFWPAFNLVEARLPQDTVQASSVDQVNAVQRAQAALSQAPSVRYATFDGRVYAADLHTVTTAAASTSEPPMAEAAPNDPLFQQQWSLQKIETIQAWNISQGDPRVVVGVIDSGYDVTHKDISPDRIWTNSAEQNGKTGVDDDNNSYVDDIHGWDWVDNDNVPNDEYGHGTHVTGIIAASTNNGLGIAGIGRNLTIAPLRILDASGSGYISNLIDALNYARLEGIRIVNLSLVISFDSPAVNDAIVAARNAGMIIISAAGNTGSTVQWPAAYPQTVAVAATDNGDKRADFSSFGSPVDVAAPGVDVLSTYRNNSYEVLSGTSMATPHVAALAGLIWSLRPDYSTDQVINLIKSTAVDVNAASSPGRDDYLGAGRIDVYHALLAASADLIVTPQDDSPRHAVGGRAVDYTVRVSVPVTRSAFNDNINAGATGTPVVGAVVYYKVISGQNATVTGRAISGANGLASFSFTAPSQSGDYIMRAQVGQVTHDTPLTVTPLPNSLALHVDASTLQAGDNTTLVHVEVRDTQGQLEQGDVPLMLTTDLGAFENGATSLTAVAHAGVYTATFHAGTKIGIAAIACHVDTLAAQQQVQIIPAPLRDLSGRRGCRP